MSGVADSRPVICCKPLTQSSWGCTWPETDCHKNGPKADPTRAPDLDVVIAPVDPVIPKPEFPPAPRRPAHEGVTRYIATLEDENTRLKAELEVLRRRYDVLLAQTNERSPEGSAR